MRSLSLDQLKAFIEVAERGSFTAAARALNLSQPAVTHQVHELEQRFGLALLERLGKRAYPTEAGEKLMEHARHLLDEDAHTRDAMRRFTDGWLGRVRIGTSMTVLMYVLPPLLRQLKTRSSSAGDQSQSRTDRHDPEIAQGERTGPRPLCHADRRSGVRNGPALRRRACRGHAGWTGGYPKDSDAHVHVALCAHIRQPAVGIASNGHGMACAGGKRTQGGDGVRQRRGHKECRGCRAWELHPSRFISGRGARCGDEYDRPANQATA